MGDDISARLEQELRESEKEIDDEFFAGMTQQERDDWITRFNERDEGERQITRRDIEEALEAEIGQPMFDRLMAKQAEDIRERNGKIDDEFFADMTQQERDDWYVRFSERNYGPLPDGRRKYHVSMGRIPGERVANPYVCPRSRFIPPRRLG